MDEMRTLVQSIPFIAQETLAESSPMESIVIMLCSMIGAVSIGWFISTNGVRLVFRILDWFHDRTEVKDSTKD